MGFGRDMSTTDGVQKRDEWTQFAEMMERDAKYADIHERIRRVERVKGKLNEYVTIIQQHVGRLEGDEMQYYDDSGIVA